MATAYPEQEDNDDPFGLGEENKEEDHDDFDENDQLLGRQPQKPKNVLKTSTSKGARPKTKSWYEQLPHEEIEMNDIEIERNEDEKELDEAEKELKKNYPRADTSKLIIRHKDIGVGLKRVVFNLIRKKAADYVLINGELKPLKGKSKKLPDKLEEILGPRVEKAVEDNYVKIAKIKELKNEENDRIKFLKNKPLNTPEELIEIETRERKVIAYDNELAKKESETERMEDGMSLRERVKLIFKKYGFTVFAVVSAVGVVISVIVSNLSKGLTKLGKGVGNGLKTIGKKLGEILPGMVGAIVSFLFKTAGEVIGFLGKNAWLLIMAVVLYFVEQFKKKRR